MAIRVMSSWVSSFSVNSCNVLRTDHLSSDKGAPVFASSANKWPWKNASPHARKASAQAATQWRPHNLHRASAHQSGSDADWYHPEKSKTVAWRSRSPAFPLRLLRILPNLDSKCASRPTLRKYLTKRLRPPRLVKVSFVISTLSIKLLLFGFCVLLWLLFPPTLWVCSLVR